MCANDLSSNPETKFVQKARIAFSIDSAFISEKSVSHVFTSLAPSPPRYNTPSTLVLKLIQWSQRNRKIFQAPRSSAHTAQELAARTQLRFCSRFSSTIISCEALTTLPSMFLSQPSAKPSLCCQKPCTRTEADTFFQILPCSQPTHRLWSNPLSNS